MKLEENVAYWCKTDTLAKKFLKECDKQGITWFCGSASNNKAYLNTNFEVYLNETCYIIENKTLQFCSRVYSEEEEYKIIEYNGKPFEIPTATTDEKVNAVAKQMRLYGVNAKDLFLTEYEVVGETDKLYHIRKIKSNGQLGMEYRLNKQTPIKGCEFVCKTRKEALNTAKALCEQEIARLNESLDKLQSKFEYYKKELKELEEE